MFGNAHAQKSCVYLFILSSIFISSFIVFSTPLQWVHAQNFITSPLNIIELSLNPDIVRPGKNYTARVQSFNTDLSNATIVWTLDGRAVKNGIGATIYEGIAPRAGTQQILTVTAQTIEGAQFQRSITLRPADVEITWYTDGITPPAFKGRAPFVIQNKITFVAIPHVYSNSGSRIDPATLTYTWLKNGAVQGADSGYGKQSYSFQGPAISRTITIGVQVSTPDGSQKGESVIEIEARNPEILVFEESPIYGVLYNKSVLENASLSSPEITYKLIPFGFSKPRSTPFNILWSLNYQEKADLKNKDFATLRIESAEDGTAIVDLDITSPEYILQRARSRFYINYSRNNANETNF